MNCQYHGCKARASFELLFVSGMKGRYCAAHMKIFDMETVEEISGIPGPKQPLDEKQAEIQRLRNTLAAVRGTLIGAWASGEVDGPDGLSYCKRVLAQIANDVGIQPGKEEASE